MSQDAERPPSQRGRHPSRAAAQANAQGSVHCSSWPAQGQECIGSKAQWRRWLSGPGQAWALGCKLSICGTACSCSAHLTSTMEVIVQKMVENTP